MKYIPKYQKPASSLPKLPNYFNYQQAQDNVHVQYPQEDVVKKEEQIDRGYKIRLAEKEKALQEYYANPNMASGVKRKPGTAVNYQAQQSVAYNDKLRDNPVGTFGPDIAMSVIPELMMLKGPQQAISRGLNKINPFKSYNPWSKPIQNTIKQVDDIPTPKFISEIDWGKWNKEIPENLPLLKEYHQIEQATKANGTWMKNTDGSQFAGTPEQFVQQNSENFKKYYEGSLNVDSNGSPIFMYHGSPNKNITSFRAPSDPRYVKNPNTTTGSSGIYFSNNKTYADQYQDFGNLGSTGKGETYQTYLAPQKMIKAGEHPVEGLPASFLWNHGDVPVDAVVAGKYMRKVYPDADLEIAIHNPNIIKSAIGNNGMFDMTNSNIYKSLFPVGLSIPFLNKNKK